MKKPTIFLVILAALMLSACGGGSQEAEVVSEPVVVEPEPVVEEVQEAEPAVVEEPVEQPVEAEPVEAEPVEAEPVSASGTTSYTSPEDIFTLEVPAGWAMETDTKTIEDTVIDTFTAPDGNAFVQVLVNEVGNDTSAVEKGQYTLDYMKRLYNEDLRVATDVQLEDGRERLEWWSDMEEISGTSYFDLKENYLFVFTVASEDDYEDDYASILEDVADSFKY